MANPQVKHWRGSKKLGTTFENKVFVHSHTVFQTKAGPYYDGFQYNARAYMISH